ncbi:Phosphoribosylglycinamide formyltransferase [Pirellula sp. SH-Sr6A]|uniref:phosphoribosylglycinamide formyltransferase n=1 Tax=Pirellula sp. SH-Sr6A TaxID=1632865 RepID=UPI00078B6526|nr:phosphoribosylglycinamide formyltransferase [Pirellula sp. SH-Sr6A]AMV31126.1 Phosphoribosylglycinamide formyltransferase [Pirellula sp. SH-Sr6A]
MTSLPIAVLISGGGTTLKNLIDLQQQNRLPVEFRLVISSRADAGGLKFASDAGIPARVVSKRKGQSPEKHSEQVFAPIRESGSQLVVMGGYLQHVLIPSDFENRVINIHPSLIPSFCGQGMYGLKVHQAAIDFGVRITGCTVHFVDNEYDHGPILLQRACEVLEDDTAESLQKRVFGVEREALPEAIRILATKWGYSG